MMEVVRDLMKRLFLLLGLIACAPEADFPETPQECSSGWDCENASRYKTTTEERHRAIVRSCETFDDKNGCLSLAYAYREGDEKLGIAKDLPKAIAIYDRICGKSDVACLFSATYREKGEVQGDAGPWFEKACRAGVRSEESAPCTKGAKANPSAASELHKMGCDRRETDSCLERAKELLASGQKKEAATLYSDTCFFRKSKEACIAAAENTEDPSELRLRLEDACKYGHAQSCERLAQGKRERERQWEEEQKKREEEIRKEQAAYEKSHPKSGGGGGGTQFSMGSANVNGMTIKNTTCTGLEGGLFGAIAITAVLGDRAAAIRACGVKGSIHATWSSDGHAIKSVTTNPPNACVQTALQSMKAAMAGSCSADLSF